jgi:hypothetical protein
MVTYGLESFGQERSPDTPTPRWLNEPTWAPSNPGAVSSGLWPRYSVVLNLSSRYQTQLRLCA